MGKRHDYVNQPDCGDAANVVAEAAADFQLVLRFEVRPRANTSYVLCLAFHQGRVNRSEVVYQSKVEFNSEAKKDLGSLLHQVALDVYMQADRARARTAFEEAVGLAPVQRLPL